MRNAPIFVFDVDGRVVVYADVYEAEQSLDAIDVDANEFPIVYDVGAHAYQVLRHVGNARLLRLEGNDVTDLCRRLSRAHGPSHLADDPAAYTDAFLVN